MSLFLSQHGEISRSSNFQWQKHVDQGVNCTFGVVMIRTCLYFAYTYLSIIRSENKYLQYINCMSNKISHNYRRANI